MDLLREFEVVYEDRILFRTVKVDVVAHTAFEAVKQATKGITAYKVISVTEGDDAGGWA